MSQFSHQRINHGTFQVVSISDYLGSHEFYRVEKQLARLLEQEHRRVLVCHHDESGSPACSRA